MFAYIITLEYLVCSTDLFQFDVRIRLVTLLGACNLLVRFTRAVAPPLPSPPQSLRICLAQGFAARDRAAWAELIVGWRPS